MSMLKQLFLIGVLGGGLLACSSDVPIGVETECRASCTGKTCGDDGCGGSCGTCEAGIGCVENRCLDRSICSDGIRNGEETDVDCGGRVCDPCPLGLSCDAPSDCISGHCAGFICTPAPTCDDGKKNGKETDVDCGGGVCDPCASDRGCVGPSDCLTGICTNDECREPSCADELQNQGESDVDCGGPVCAPCPTTKTCSEASDCASGVCRDLVCAPAPSCLDEMKNGNESDVDCGGTLCDGCATGRFCSAPTDCLSGICTNGVCRDASCFDGLKNQNESDVDCGGVCDAKCAVDEVCRVNGDCDSNVCDGGTCAACQSTCLNEGVSRCDGDMVQTCLSTGNGCFAWSASVSCGAGRLCDASAGQCVNAGCDDVPADGRCLNNSTVEYCATSPADGASFVRTLVCDGSASCQHASGRAQCVVPSDSCREGATSCLGANNLRTCVGGSWQSYTCPSGCTSSNPFESFCKPSQASTTFSGKLSYETRAPNAAKTDWGTASQTAGIGFLVVSMVTDTETNERKPFDATFTKSTDGAFSIKVPASPGVDDEIVVFAAGVGTNSAHRYAVADPGFGASGTQRVGALGASARVWNWSWRLSDVPASKTLVIGEQQGAGAARVFDKMRAVFAKAESTYPSKTGASLVGWVGYGTSWDCDSCFAPWPQAVSNDFYQSQLWVSAGADQSYWDDSRTLHELGHWVMSSYGTSPDEVGPQRPGVPTFAAQAWSEGFATWFSSVMRNDPVSVSKRAGSMFWFDISARQYGNGTAWQRASPSGGVLQKMDSNEVAAMLWTLGAANELTLFEALASPRMNSSPWYRGYTRRTWKMSELGTHTNVVDTHVSRPSLPDFFDTLICSGFSASAMDGVTEPSSAYPYSTADRAMCEGGCNPANCGGCCQGNTCRVGTELAACGVSGGSCNVCSSSQACSAGACVCNPASCPSGCCAGNTCATGTTVSQCGAGGLACVPCEAGQTCDAQSCKSAAGSECVNGSDCVTDLLCISEPTSPKRCRTPCVLGSTTCGAGLNCVKPDDSSYAVCVPAPAASSKWEIRFDSAVIRQYDLSGGNWDPGGAAPDPFMCLVFLPSETKICSARKSTTRNPVWNETAPGDYLYSSLARVRIELWDYDSTSANDLMLISAESNVQPRRAGYDQHWEVKHPAHADRGVEVAKFTIVAN